MALLTEVQQVCVCVLHFKLVCCLGAFTLKSNQVTGSFRLD
jgi:hypothetical protein